MAEIEACFMKYDYWPKNQYEISQCTDSIVIFAR